MEVMQKIVDQYGNKIYGAARSIALIATYTDLLDVFGDNPEQRQELADSIKEAAVDLFHALEHDSSTRERIMEAAGKVLEVIKEQLAEEGL